ncbi:MAG TPA: carboxypeptidase regulatory-like domain-containing protein [Bryobacteraceae bacterium]|nr:carboxypeptidase regulatory-like domain-containing protein [Bryobacteraceae bacterium]
MKRLLAAPLVFLAACGSSTQPKTETESSLPVAHVDPATAGMIIGSIKFEGKPPVMAAIDMSSNPQCERQHHSQQKAETVVVNGNGTLRNVFVWIKDGLPRERWEPPAQSAKLDQIGCVYSPHVLGIMQGQKLEILNSDPVNHNVHAESQINPPWNESEPPRAEHKVKEFDSAEVLFPMTCSVHPWMRSYVAVSPHPFFAVTGDDGTFALKGVPPGTYTIEAVHEQYGRREGKVTLTPNGSATLDFTYGG